MGYEMHNIIAENYNPILIETRRQKGNCIKSKKKKISLTFTHIAQINNFELFRKEIS